MRPIDADAFEERIIAMVDRAEKDLSDSFKHGILTALRMLKNQPTIEPKTGRWIPMKVSSGRNSWKCSECGRRARGKLENLPYCHCGCKMEVEHDKSRDY